MPIAQWLKTRKIKTSTPTTIGLPDPNERQNNKEAMILDCKFRSWNSPANFPCSTKKKKKKTRQLQLCRWWAMSEIFKTCGLKNGVANAAQHMTNDLVRNVAHVKNIKDQYNRLRRALDMITNFISKFWKEKKLLYVPFVNNRIII